MRAYKLKIAAGAHAEIAAIGNYVRLNSADIGLEVAVSDPDSVAAAIMQAGDSLSLENFKRLIVSHNAAVEKTVTIYIGQDTRMDSSRVAGVVEVINGELSRVLAGNAFSGPASITAGAGNYASLQLWNPAGSGKRLVVSRFNLFTFSTAAGVPIFITNAATANLVSLGRSKYIGGAPGVGELRSLSGASLLNAGKERVQTVALSGALAMIDAPLAEPYVLPPGFGLTLENETAGSHLSASFQWMEESL